MLLFLCLVLGGNLGSGWEVSWLEAAGTISVVGTTAVIVGVSSMADKPSVDRDNIGVTDPIPIDCSVGGVDWLESCVTVVG